MLSSKLVLAAELLASVPAASHASVYSVSIFSDASCSAPAAQSQEVDEYSMRQVDGDKHCYVHNGYSLKVLCDDEDTVKVAHWFDVSGKGKPCTGEALGQPLLEYVPWELAVGFFKGECTWNSGLGAYGKLSAALPLDGYPTCDLTGASIRRLTSNSTNSSQGAPNASTPTSPTPPALPLATTPAAANNSAANSNNSNNSNNSAIGENITSPTTTVAASDGGVASGASSLCVVPAVAAGAAVVVFMSIVV